VALALASGLGAAACQNAGTPPAPAPAPATKAPRAATPAPRVTLTGTVEVPADAPASYALRQAEGGKPLTLRPAAGARVYLADAAGAALPGLEEDRTDAQGRYTFAKVPPGYSYMVVAEVPAVGGKVASFRTLVKVTELGASAAIDPATTMVTAGVLEGLPGGDLGELNPARFQALRTRVGGLLRPGQVPDFTDGVQVREQLRQLVQQNQELRTVLSQVQDELREVKAGMASLRAELARGPAAPGPAVAGSDAPAAPEASPTNAAAPAPTPLASSAAPSASAGPRPSPQPDEFAWVRKAVTGPGLSYKTFSSAAAGGEVSYHIYTPPAYQAEPTRRFPVVYWLHGTGGGEGGMAQFAKLFDDAIRARKIPPVLVVFPNGLPRGMYVDSFDGARKVEGMLIGDLVPHIDQAFRTKAERAGRLIEGFSMGGYGAGRLGFKHHKLFGGISMFAGGPLDLAFEGARASTDPESRAFLMAWVYGELPYYQAVSPWRMAEANVAALKAFGPLRVVIGDKDSSYAKNVAFHEHLQALGLPHDYHVVPGVSHEMPGLVSGLGDTHWAFYRKVFGAP
jgi:enterochelin esterase-like enzyme